MKLFLTILTIIFISCSANAQNIPKHSISLNYLGESYTHAGLSLWYDYAFFEKEKTKTNRKGKEKTQFIQLKLHNRIGFYHHAHHRNGWLHTSGVMLQRSNPKGTLIGISIIGGYQTTFLNDDTYQVNDNGEVEKMGIVSSTDFLLGLHTRLGKEYFFKNQNNRWGWHIASSIHWVRPFQWTTQLLPTFEMGTSYKF